MASFDDLAFTGPPSANMGSGVWSVDASWSVDSRRQQRPGNMSGALFGGTEASAQDLQAIVMRLLTQIGGDWNGGDTGARRPASDEAVRNLGSFVADQASTVEVAVVVKGIKSEVIAIPGNFGPCEALKERNVVVADPFDGAIAFQNANEMKDKIVVMARGGCTFARKVLRAQEAGAAGVIIIQTVDIWPYTMTDSTGESKGVTIPAFMMSAKVGNGFVAFLRGKRDEGVSADVIVRKDARECVICQVEMSIGMKVTRMPCQHMFHTACLHEWLQIGNSCPICRVEIAAKRTAHNGSSTSQNAQQRGDFAWSEWFS
ncbi:zinc finger family protein [Phytophthora cinnamomi]|uniref:zinc finger family protein n=1 Tax=Phytophthora cinnamomi TaxID=4785 RepID=UPI003559802D|nr:zinc finger family protein [Phytophthora cinnamomi]